MKGILFIALAFVAGLSVEVIKENAFENSGLMAIKVPPTVKEIGDKAFKGCGKLISAIMPERLKSIGSEAFEGCLRPYLRLPEEFFQGAVCECASGSEQDKQDRKKA